MKSKNVETTERLCQSTCSWRVKKDNPSYRLLQCTKCGYQLKDFSN